ncbi:hypothetical protein BKA63DRAFT_429239 [Paraphoma chrysanthemicola]|nr:hypothetical protein BKA63DRAFT_429239 [Paraphoma chrysanthemicola]
MVAPAPPTAASHIERRAGAPPIIPIPLTCTITNPLPTSSSAAYTPAPSSNDALLYSAYYPSFSKNKTEMAEQCLQQCYGYGHHVECKTAFWAENVIVPAGYYGILGGQLSTGCLFFNRTLVSSDFEIAPPKQATDGFAGNIAC